MLLGANRVGLGPVGGPAATAPADFERGLAEKVAKLRREVSALHDDALEELRAENEALRSRLSLLEAGGSHHGASDKSSPGEKDGIDFERALEAVAEEAEAARKESPAVAAARVVAEEQKAQRRADEVIAQRRAEEAAAKKAAKEAAATKVSEEAEAARKQQASQAAKVAAEEQKAKRRAEEAASRRRAEEETAAAAKVAEEAAAAKEAAAARRAAEKATAAKTTGARKVGIDPLTGLPIDDSAASSGDEVEILVRHAMDNVEAWLLVPAAANFLDVKQAISRHMGSDEVLKKGRLVRRRDGKFAAFKDDEEVGDTREVLLIGATLMAKSAEARASPHEAKATPAAGSSPPARKAKAFSTRVAASPPKGSVGEDMPGRYRIVCDSIVKEGPSRTSGNLGELEVGDVVQVLEVRDMANECRVRGRIDRGAGQSGWISLLNNSDGSRLAARVGDTPAGDAFDFDDLPEF